MYLDKSTRLVIGYTAALCSAAAFAPQVWDVYKKHNAKFLSLTTLIIFFVGQLLWITYGFCNEDYTVIGSGIINSIFYSYLLFAKCTYK